MRKTQLIAAVIATACAGVGTSAMACGTCGGGSYGSYGGWGGYGGIARGWGGYGNYGYRTFARPAPVGEFLTTRTFIRQRPACFTRTVRVISRPAPVAELVTTRRVFVQRRLAPVAERVSCFTEPAPVRERIITRRVAVADSGYCPSGYTSGYTNGFGRVVTAPFRFVGNAVTWPFRRATYRSQPEIVGERILVTRVATYPAKRTHISKRHHTRVHKSMHHGKRQAKYSKRLAPVGERVVNMKCTIQ